jgi:hypothetical protein
MPLTVHGQTTLPAFSTFLKANSSIQQIATDPSGNIYVVGQVPANDQDVFVTKVNPGNAGFAWIVYFGGSSVETAGGLAVDAAGNAYMQHYFARFSLYSANHRTAAFRSVDADTICGEGEYKRRNRLLDFVFERGVGGAGRHSG